MSGAREAAHGTAEASVIADDYIKPRHGLGQEHVVALAEAPVLVFLHEAVTETDDHIHLLPLAEMVLCTR